MIKQLFPKIILIALFLMSGLIFAQVEVNSKIANEHFNDGNFNAALTEYLTLLNTTPEDPKFNYRIGVCYLNTNIDKAKAIPYLEKVLNEF